jgi:hypothetical protein
MNIALLDAGANIKAFLRRDGAFGLRRHRAEKGENRRPFGMKSEGVREF